MILIRVLFQTVFLALTQIWSNKFRALLTTLGIVIGVAAVIGTVAATNGLKDYVLNEFQTFGARKVFIDGRVPRKQRGRIPQWKTELTLPEVEAIRRQATTMDKYTPLFYMSYDLQNGDTSLKSVTTLGIWPQWHDIESRYTTLGRTFTTIDEEQRSNVCMINDKTIELLGMDRDPVGEFILIGGRRFLIVGVVETRVLGPLFGGGEAQAEAFIPLSVAMAMNPGRPWVNYLLANLKSEDLADEAKQEIGFILRKARNLMPDDEPTFDVGVVQQVIDQFNRVGAAITLGPGGIVGISLVVGGIGIMNIMLVSVSERTREIGLRKAVGAPPIVILMQFLVEAVVLCMVGAAIGMVIGFALSLALSSMPDSPLAKASVPAWAVWLSVGFSTATGIIFGMFPAIKAARLDPIEALRHE